MVEIRKTKIKRGQLTRVVFLGFKYTAEKNYAGVSSCTQGVQTDFYVDDFITSVETTEEAYAVLSDGTELLSTTEFTLTSILASGRKSWTIQPKNSSPMRKKN